MNRLSALVATGPERNTNLMFAALFFVFSAVFALWAVPGQAQSFSFQRVVVEGNERIEAGTIVEYAGIARGESVSAAQLNDAYQRVFESGLFETVEFVPQGATLLIRVAEWPTINRVAFEGNRRIDDEALSGVVQSQSRRVYSPAQAEADAAAIAELYAQAGRLAARVDPKIILQPGRRVDLVFEIAEGRVSEIERIAFTGNRAYSDRRLRQVLETKQAGVLRAFIRSDTFVGDRIAFDRQLLTDFYRSRGYIDFEVTGVSSDFSRDRGAFFITFAVQEGLKYRFGEVTAISEYEGVDAAPYQDTIRIRQGSTYSPAAVDLAITRMEGLALQQGLDFLRVEPRITRNDATQTLDVTFVLNEGPRVFVERIDIQGNATTLDRVIRRQFRTVEGDPFNPREIREAAERIRALGFFETAEVDTRRGSANDQVIVDVDVEERPTGSLTFGVSYSVTNGVGANVSFSEANFLGRGQFLSFSLSQGLDDQNSSFTFIEPAFLGRDLRFRMRAFYITSDQDDELYDTKSIGFTPSIGFPISEMTRMELRLGISEQTMENYGGSSTILAAEAARGSETKIGVGYGLTYDSRRTGLNPNAGVRLRFGQDFNGLGGDVTSIETTALATAETKVLNEEVTLRAEVEGGFLTMLDGQDSRAIDRYFGNGKIRGFGANGIGPVEGGEALGGNNFAVLRLESEFPVGLPEEYGISGGLFMDVGSVWGLDAAGADPGTDDLNLRAVAGVSVFWTTPLGPLRFNFSKAIQKEDYDDEQTFDLTVSTRF